MKAFAFRLDRVLHWRVTQVTLQQTKTSTAAGKLAAIEKTLEAMRKEEMQARAGLIGHSATGAGLNSFAAFSSSIGRRIKDVEGQAGEARKALGIELIALKEANRKSQLLENLKETRQTRWQKDFERETAAIADEAFLSSRMLKKQDGRPKAYSTMLAND
jgi:flagellar export protein FliJ